MELYKTPTHGHATDSFFKALVCNKDEILNDFKDRARNHRHSGSTEILVNALINKNERQNCEVNLFKLDKKGQEIFFLIQYYEFAHMMAGASEDWKESDLKKLAEEMNI